MMNFRKLCFLLSLMIPFVGNSQEVSVVPIPYPMDRFITNIVGMCQDEQGFLWLADNFKGLIRFDGSQRKYYKSNPYDADALSTDHLECLFAGRKGGIWIGTADSGLDHFDPETESFTHFQHDPADPFSLCDNRVFALLEDSKGTLWVGTNKGLDTLNAQTGKFTHITDRSEDGLLLNEATVRALYEDKAGNIWVGCGNTFGEAIDDSTAGLYKLAKNTRLITRYYHNPEDSSSLIDNRVRAIFEDSRHTFWIGTAGDGLHQMDREKGTFRRSLYDPENPQQISRPPFVPNADFAIDHITFINEDQQGCIWIGTYAGGINRYDPRTQTTEFFGISGAGSRNLGKNDFWAALKTKDNLLWVSGWEPQNENQVLYKITTFSEQLDYTQIGERVNCFAQDPEIGIWIGTKQGLVGHHVNESTDAFFARAKSILDSSRITFLGFDRFDNLWASTFGGLYHFDRKSGDHTVYRHDQEDPNSLSSPAVLDVLPRDDGTTWIANYEGLDILDMSKGIIIRHQSNPEDSTSLSANWVTKLYEDSKGRIWIGTNKGLNLYDSEKGIFKGMINRNSAAIFDIFEDSRQQIWVSTYRSGLYRYDRNSTEFLPFYDSTGLITNNLLVKGIVENKGHSLWLNTDIGFIQLNPETGNAVLFGLSWKNDSDNDFNSSETFISKSGEIFTGNARGYYHFTTEDLNKEYRHEPELYWSRFFIGDREIRPGTDKILSMPLNRTDELRLAHHQNTFALEFGNIDFVTHDSEKNVLYKLGNYDPKWRKSGSENRAYYYDVPPGKYVLTLKSSNRYGRLGERSMSILILSPWYSRWWAWGAYGLLFLSMLYGSHEFLLRRRMVKEKVSRLQEMDQLKTRLYTNLTHEFRTPITVISGMADQVLEDPGEWFREGLQAIKRNSRQLLGLVNQFLDLSRLESGSLPVKMLNDDIIRYIRYLTESFHSYAETKDIRLHLFSNIEEFYMDFDPEKLRVIFSNLLGNAIKFTSSCGDVYVTIEAEEGGGNGILRLIVKDTGIGIPEHQLPYIFDRFFQADNSSTRPGEGTGIGLALTKELVHLFGGSVGVKSRRGKGSEFTLELPVSREAPRVADKESGEDLLLEDKSYVEALALPALNADGELPMVLLIEDNRDVLQYLVISLRGQYHIEMATNGQEGIEKAIQLVPDVIISDIMMPVQDGFAVAKTLKQMELTSHIPIILLTARADIDSRVKGLEYGADAYLGKPFEKRELLVRIRKLIEWRGKLRDRYAKMDPNLPSDDHQSTRLDPFLQKLERIVEANLEDGQFSVNQLCSELGISRTQLHRKLKALTSKSTSQVIRTIRMQRAKALLRDPDLNISEIGYSVGYGSPSHFTQEFTKEFGKAPSQFRRE